MNKVDGVHCMDTSKTTSNSASPIFLKANLKEELNVSLQEKISRVLQEKIVEPAMVYNFR